MKVYDVTCEGVVTRQVTVEAANVIEAAQAARQEFASLLGADKDAVAVIEVEKQGE